MVWLSAGRKSMQKVQKSARISKKAGVKEIRILFSLYSITSQV